MNIIEEDGLYKFDYRSKKYMHLKTTHIKLLDRNTGKHARMLFKTLKANLPEEEFTAIEYGLFSEGEHMDSSFHIVEDDHVQT